MAATLRIGFPLLLLLGLGTLLWSLGNAAAEEPQRAVVPRGIIHFDDGDTIRIDWPGKAAEEIRILGIDTPEVLHLEHDIPYPQPFGYEAAGFLRGCIAAADRVELLRAGTKDQYGRTLGYLYVNGKNYSPLVIAARLAYGPNPRFGDNGLPQQYQACLDAAKAAGTPPFEPPWQYRRRMREVAAHMKKAGTYPACPPKADAPAPKDK